MTLAEPATHRHAVFHRLRVSAVDPLTADAVAVTFEVPPELAPDYRFRPGQHVAIRATVAGDDVRRNYSICSAAGGPLRIAVKRLPGGVFSAYAMEALRPGDELEVMTPSGRFGTPLDPGRVRSYAALAAGSGITPVLSILASALAVEPRSEATLVYANRNSASVMFLEELADLKDRYPDRFTVLHVMSREPREVELLSGRLDAAKLRRLLASVLPPSQVDEWFLCGPQPMLVELRQTLLAAGVPAEQVHAELFHTGPAEPRPAEAPLAGTGESLVTVVLDGRSSTFRLGHAGPRILDAALAVRGDAPYACKGGVCGTCRAKLTSGVVRMERNYALEEAEVAAGFVLACQSHPASEAVTLDFDASS